MKFIKSSVEIVNQENTVIGGFKHIEKAARNCYRSEDKITDDSWKHMTDVLLKKGHLSPFEHATVYLTLDRSKDRSKFLNWMSIYGLNPYTKVNIVGDIMYVTTNYRVIYENGLEDDLQYMTEPTQFHEKRMTVRVKCSIGISREWNRHRTMSISEMSTRYCNYSKGKFGNEITVIIPEWVYAIRDAEKLTSDSNTLAAELYEKDWRVKKWVMGLLNDESDYLQLVNQDSNDRLSAQEARGLLPLDTATCVYYTAFESDWRKFINLRTSNAAHPDIRVLANQLKETWNM